MSGCIGVRLRACVRACVWAAPSTGRPQPAYRGTWACILRSLRLVLSPTPGHCHSYYNVLAQRVTQCCAAFGQRQIPPYNHVAKTNTCATSIHMIAISRTGNASTGFVMVSMSLRD